MDEAEAKLKVTDRRHFTADGQLREGASGDSPAAEAPPPRAEAPPPTAEASLRTEAPPDPSEEVAPVNFSSFIISLATQAADFMGGETRDLGGARQVISALEMLKDKTEGRRTEEESKIIDAILFDLRLAFVGLAKGTRS